MAPLILGLPSLANAISMRDHTYISMEKYTNLSQNNNQILYVSGAHNI